MIKRIKDLLSNFSNQEEEIKDEKISSLDNANNGDIILVEPGVSSRFGDSYSKV